MTVITDAGSIFVGSKIVIPMPEEDDTWEDGMIAEVDDITDDDMIIFNDDFFSPHEIEVSRVQLYKG